MKIKSAVGVIGVKKKPKHRTHNTKFTADAYKELTLRRDLRDQIISESIKNTKRMEIERLKGELAKMSPAMREMALTRIAALK